MSRSLAIAALLVPAALASHALAQSNIAPAHKLAWSENCGYLNFRDAGSPAASRGARLSSSRTYLSGFVWGENIGWINLGSAPADGAAYSNLTGADFGVNHDPNTGALSGLGWGENIGWINFAGGAMASPGAAARIAVELPRRFYGFAWSENVGWINLDSASTYVQLRLCAADFNEDGLVSVQDIFDYLNAWFALTPETDIDGAGVVNAQDIFDFLSLWFAGC